MRIDIHLSDDLARQLRDDARRRGVTVEEAAVLALRRGLEDDDTMRCGEPVVLETISSGFVDGVDPNGLNRLADLLD